MTLDARRIRVAKAKAKARAKKTTRTGARRTGTRPGSGKKRGNTSARAQQPKTRGKRRTTSTPRRGAQAKRGTRGGTAKRTSARGASAKSAARSTKRTPARPKARSAPRRDSARETGGPSLPLRDLLRGGMPRSSKARAGARIATSPWAKRREKSAHGITHAAGMLQHQPAPLIRHGYTREAIYRRG
jgi:hypothetical protein